MITLESLIVLVDLGIVGFVSELTPHSSLDKPGKE